MKRFLLTLFFCHVIHELLAQENFVAIQKHVSRDFPVKSADQDSKAKNDAKKWIVAGASTAVLAGSIVYLTQISNYKYSKGFHTKNDNKAWMQMDKCTHAFVAYTSNRLLSETYEWAGFRKQEAILISSTSILTYMSLKEFLDGHIAGGGWSWGDMGANAFGISLFAAQELGWKEQKIQYKLSAFPRKYPADLKPRTDEIYGTNIPKKLLKDYNAQTYWLSFNINSFTKSSKIPDWLNISFGYGADGIYGAASNYETENGQVIFDRRDIKRYRQFYISPDIDFTKIKTKSKLLKTFFVVANAFKMPLPALEISEGKIKGRLVQF
ncbi:MAG: DUF2279 domain-containing protein [Sphingobacteriales bacterium]|nr:MAG: DUF2279 domain-containing protein [Sphingobacteriales bacterium]